MRERGRPIAIPRLEQSCDNDTGLDRIKGADPYSGPCGISAGHCRLTQYQNTPGPPLLLRLHEITSDGSQCHPFSRVQIPSGTPTEQKA